MSNKELTTNRDDVERTLERASYLASETRMLKRVIDYVPYDEKPPQKPSILDVLDKIRNLQSDYFKTLVQKLSDESFPISYRNVTDWYEQVEKNSGTTEDDVQQILLEITRHREKILDQLEDLNTENWDKIIKQGEKERRVVEVIEEIIEFERSLLSNISDQVRVFSQQRNNQREIESRKKSRNPSD